MSKLDEAGLPEAPEGMHWRLDADVNGNILLHLDSEMSPSSPQFQPGGYMAVKSVRVVDADRNFPQTVYPGLLVNRAQEILSWWEIMAENKTWLGVTGRDVSA